MHGFGCVRSSREFKRAMNKFMNEEFVLIASKMTFSIKSPSSEVLEAVRAARWNFPACFFLFVRPSQVFDQSSRPNPDLSLFAPIQPFSCSSDTGNQRDVPL